ncbi:hypothetical protein THRCLA_20976 [Thraustotheca clavata]|uniref:Uncharacterized protein n=1 Tax=Thraustotheca clavata TaxID=74557 RepID=A0A1W0A1G8_9STRA|nr:hypothetical protein THRCLA_20976 [Thraustotheca clavata]
MPTPAVTSKELQALKRVELQRTSIAVGYDVLEYSTSAKDMNAHAAEQRRLSPKELEQRKYIKTYNRGQHFDLGDANEAKLTYATSSRQVDPTGNMQKYTAKLNVEAQAMLMRTSATLGYEKPELTTSTKDATQWSRAAMDRSIVMRQETRKLTGPKKCPFEFGDDQIEYVSTAKGTMNFDRKDAKSAVMAADVKEDLRKCHYSFGNDKMEYTTSSNVPKIDTEYYREMAKKQVPSNDPYKNNVYFS